MQYISRARSTSVVSRQQAPSIWRKREYYLIHGILATEWINLNPFNQQRRLIYHFLRHIFNQLFVLIWGWNNRQYYGDEADLVFNKLFSRSFSRKYINGWCIKRELFELTRIIEQNTEIIAPNWGNLTVTMTSTAAGCPRLWQSPSSLSFTQQLLWPRYLRLNRWPSPLFVATAVKTIWLHFPAILSCSLAAEIITKTVISTTVLISLWFVATNSGMKLSYHTIFS